MMHQATAMNGPPLVQGLFKGIENEAPCAVRLTRQPTMQRA